MRPLQLNTEANGLLSAAAKFYRVNDDSAIRIFHVLQRAFGRARAMAHTFRHDEALPRRKIDYAIFEIDQEPPIEHEKELIDVFMFVPVIFALNDRHPDN